MAKLQLRTDRGQLVASVNIPDTAVLRVGSAFVSHEQALKWLVGSLRAYTLDASRLKAVEAMTAEFEVDWPGELEEKGKE